MFHLVALGGAAGIALLAVACAGQVRSGPADGGSVAVDATGTAPAIDAASGESGDQAATLIVVNARADGGTVNKSVLGQAYLWPFDGMGSFDPIADDFYPQFLSQLAKVVEPGSLRYPGGITGEVFHWQRAVGPRLQRKPNAFAPAQVASSSTVGPDEFGHLLDTTGADGVVTVNFGTGTEKEAAAFVSYMTGAAGSSKWADLRVANGHPKPYNVPWWEVGNEEFAALYWRGGKVVSVGGPPGACRKTVTCLYIYGGSTQFTKQAVVRYADRSPGASSSTGAPDQSVYATYPPVTAGTATVYVGAAAWKQVSSLTGAAPTDHVYVLNPASGQITFGDGMHGAVPPKGDKITLSYVSGPHSGFLQYYQAMKAANPSIKVCSTDTSTDFVESMGSTVRYDCLQQHNYASVGTVANDVPIVEYEKQLMAASQKQAGANEQLENTIEHNAGRYVPLVETEYGQLLSSNPDGYPYFHDSLDEALLNASQLAEWIRLGIPVANRQLLTAEIPPPTSCCAGLPGAAPYATTGAIGTPGPSTVLEATGQVYKLFAPLADGTVLSAQTMANPVLTGTGTSSVRALSVLAVRKGQSLYLVGINRSPTDAASTRVLLEGVLDTGPVDFERLDGPSPLSYNTAAKPDTVSLSSGQLAATGGDFDVTFPAHSVTTLRVPIAETPGWSLGVQAGAQPNLVDPGGQVTLQATVADHGGTGARGRVEPIVPHGWSVEPAGDSYAVNAGSQTQVQFHVTAPSDAAKTSYKLGVILFAPDGSVVDVATTNVNVPYGSLEAAYNNVAISDDSEVDSADFDGVGNSYSEQSLTAAGLGPGATVNQDGVKFTWPNVGAGQLDDVVAQGQTIRLSAAGTTLGFLGASTGEPIATGPGTVYYADGSQSSFTLTLYGFFNPPPGTADGVVASMPYVNSQGIGGRPRGQRKHTVYVFYTSVPIDANKTVEAVTLPAGGTIGSSRISGMHFFALAVK